MLIIWSYSGQVSEKKEIKLWKLDSNFDVNIFNNHCYLTKVNMTTQVNVWQLFKYTVVNIPYIRK